MAIIPISWTKASNTTSQHLYYRKKSVGGAWLDSGNSTFSTGAVVGAGVESSMLNNADPNLIYQFKIVSICNQLTSSDSNIFEGMTQECLSSSRFTINVTTSTVQVSVDLSNTDVTSMYFQLHINGIGIIAQSPNNISRSGNSITYTFSTGLSANTVYDLYYGIGGTVDINGDGDVSDPGETAIASDNTCYYNTVQTSQVINCPTPLMGSLHLNPSNDGLVVTVGNLSAQFSSNEYNNITGVNLYYMTQSAHTGNWTGTWVPYSGNSIAKSTFNSSTPDSAVIGSASPSNVYKAKVEFTCASGGPTSFETNHIYNDDCGAFDPTINTTTDSLTATWDLSNTNVTKVRARLYDNSNTAIGTEQVVNLSGNSATYTWSGLSNGSYKIGYTLVYTINGTDYYI